MNQSKITIALALAGIAGAQTPAGTDVAPAAQEAPKVAESQVQNVALEEKLDAVDGKVDGLNDAFLDTKSTVDGLKKLKISGFIQFQYAYNTDTNLTSSPGYASKQGAWALRRARLKFSYDAGNGAVLVWQPNFLESKFETKDAYIQYTEQWLKAIYLRAGIQDIPFGFEIGNSSSGMELIERSRFENNSIFNGEKTLGVVAGYSSSDFPYVNLKAGWLNGQPQAAVTSDWSATQDPKNFVGRAGVSFAFNDAGLSIDAGQSVFYDAKYLTDTTSNAAGAGYIKEVRNDSLVKVYGKFRTQVRTIVSGEDVQLTYEIPYVGGLKVLAEYYQGKVAGQAGNIKLYTGAAYASSDIRNVQGYYAAAILNPVAFLPQLQLVYRFDYYDPNTDVSGSTIDAKRGFSSTDIAYTTNTVGLNWFVNGNFKISLFYDFVANETTSAPSLDGWSSDASRTVALGALKTGTYTAKSDFSKNIKDDVLTLRGQVAF